MLKEKVGQNVNLSPLEHFQLEQADSGSVEKQMYKPCFTSVNSATVSGHRIQRITVKPWNLKVRANYFSGLPLDWELH